MVAVTFRLNFWNNPEGQKGHQHIQFFPLQKQKTFGDWKELKMHSRNRFKFIPKHFPWVVILAVSSY